MALEEGKKAPAFTLLGSDGEKHSLKDALGKIVVVYFYPKDDTPGCTKEACGFRDLHGDLEQEGVVVYGVSRDDLDSHTAFIEKYELPFVLLSDPKGTMMEKYGAWGEKNMYGKVTVGVIRSTVIIGEDGKLLKRWKRVSKAADHPQKVAEWIESYRKGE
ncbi:peroxiredoxin [bacterium]|nr:peroxiredoxin [bacterium]